MNKEKETSPFQHVVPGPERGGDGLLGAAQRAVRGARTLLELREWLARMNAVSAVKAAQTMGDNGRYWLAETKRTKAFLELADRLIAEGSGAANGKAELPIADQKGAE